MSHEMSTMDHHGSRGQVGSKPFNHNQSQEAEQEYDRLCDLARQEAQKRGQCFERSKEAYNRGDGGGAKQLSNEGKEHGAKMEQYNKQASEFIFRENNAQDRVPADTIDLHGQYVEEAEDILEERIRYAQQTGQTHLHVIVGKGNHSPGHIQKIKPRVEQICQQLNLQYHTEPNEGRMYVNLTGGAVDMNAVNNWQGNQQGYQHGGYGNQAYPSQPHNTYQQGPPQQQYQQPQQPQYQQQQYNQQQQEQDGGGDLVSQILRSLKKCLCS
ncbi:hypothetical protein LTR66_015782 [Elasticomyces elasticus]|nr:hypothetical protein LTR66_015782 [Elasticomyces elasticus]